MTAQRRSRWYRSFYWRIGISFVVFVLVVIIAQSVMFSYLFARANMQNAARSPNNLATAVAADLGSAFSKDPGLDLGAHLVSRYGRDPWRVFVVMRSGEVAGNSAENLSDEIRRSAESALVQTDVESDETRPRLPGPVVTAPIQIGNELRGLVVLPPPPPGGALRDVGRLLSLPGTLLLIAATVAAAAVIFGPARRRLSALEDAAGRLGNGDLTARARQEGDDEIGRVARAFNRMADELAVRDEALKTSDRLRRQMLADVSHELKTPLTAMRGFIETLRMPEVVLDDERRARYLETVERETRRLERIVGDLLDLARYREWRFGSQHSRVRRRTRIPACRSAPRAGGAGAWRERAFRCRRACRPGFGRSRSDRASHRQLVRQCSSPHAPRRDDRVARSNGSRRLGPVGDRFGRGHRPGTRGPRLRSVL